MEQLIKDARLGEKEILYRENIWTGKREIFVNGEPCRKVSRMHYTYLDGEREQSIDVKGNSLSGVKLHIGNEAFTVVSAPKWYEWVLALAALVFILIWGNIPATVNMFVVAGGALGGLISGIFMVSSMVAMRQIRQVWLKILIGLAFSGLTILVCHYVGVAILGALT